MQLRLFGISCFLGSPYVLLVSYLFDALVISHLGFEDMSLVLIVSVSISGIPVIKLSAVAA